MIGLIERTTPFWRSRFETQTIERVNGHDLYEIESAADRIILRGSSDSALCAAYYRYLQEFCDMDLSPSGNTEVYESKSVRTPKKKVSQILSNDLRFTLSYEAYANDACSWDWDRWSQMLDYFALQGVNLLYMPVGQEAVWYYTALDLDISREDAMEFLSGPNFYGYQLAGKLDSYFPLTDTNYLKAQIELGQKILARMKELGIAPVLPAFSGHVPKYIKGYFPDAALYFVTPFGRFPFTYRIFPDDPLFAKLAGALRTRQIEYFGTADYYMADPFLSVEPRAKNSGLISAAGQAILSEIQKANASAVWVQTGCSLTSELNSNVDKNAVLILNGTNDEGISASGLPYLAAISYNPGANTVLSGNVLQLLERPVPQSASGLAVLCGDTQSNPLYAACAFSRLTQDGAKSAESVFVSEALRRWGSDEACLKNAAQLLLKTVYNADAPDIPLGSIPASRPATELSHTAPGDTLALHYDNRTLLQALEQLLASEGDYTDGYAFDVCDLTRQVLSNYARRLYIAVMEGYGNRDSRLFELATNSFLRTLDDMESILSTRPEFSLRRRMFDAGERGEGNTVQQNYEITLLVSVTLFGPTKEPELYDLCWKEWSGLLGEYYAKRWHFFFELLADQFRKRKNVSTVCREQIDGRNPSRGSAFYKRLDKAERKWISTCNPAAVSEEDTLEVAEALLKKYKPLIEQDTL